MLSGTATMDFGGTKNAGTAVGLIDGCVYLGTGLQAWALGRLTTQSWSYWPPFLVPFALIGVLLAIRIRKAIPDRARK
jgi:OPA family glycerol-3-phosphate transporter-like MFS transporter